MLHRPVVSSLLGSTNNGGPAPSAMCRREPACACAAAARSPSTP